MLNILPENVFQLAQQVAVVVASPIFRSLHRLTITERIEYKLLSLTYVVKTTIKALTTEPSDASLSAAKVATVTVVVDRIALH